MATEFAPWKSEEKMLRLLRRHPEIAQRFEALAQLADGSSGPILAADEIEQLLLQARLKLAGCAWTRDHAQRMAQLRVLRANGQWQQLWN